MSIGNRGGRPRKPTALHKLAGTFRPDRHGGDEPKPPVADVTAPSSLDDAERAIWSEAAEMLRALGILTVADRAALTRYCAARVEYEEARRELRVSGKVIVGTNGVQMRSPWITIRDAANKTLADLEREFGMTPASRPRLGRLASPPPPPPGAEPARGSLAELIERGRTLRAKYGMP